MKKSQFIKYRKRTKYDLEKSKKMNNFSYLNKNICRQNQIVLVGDSITELFNMELFDEFCKVYGVNIYNRGISGDTSDRLLERLDENVLNINPKAVVLLIGINDLTAGADVEYIAGNIEATVERIRNSNPNTLIVLQAVYPVNTKMYRSIVLKKAAKKISTLNSKIKSIANKYGTDYIDFTNKLSDSDGMFSSELTYDGLHPTAKGFSVVANEIESILTQYFDTAI